MLEFEQSINTLYWSKFASFIRIGPRYYRSTFTSPNNFSPLMWSVFRAYNCDFQVSHFQNPLKDCKISETISLWLLFVRVVRRNLSGLQLWKLRRKDNCLTYYKSFNCSWLTTWRAAMTIVFQRSCKWATNARGHIKQIKALLEKTLVSCGFSQHQNETSRSDRTTWKGRVHLASSFIESRL